MTLDEAIKILDRSTREPWEVPQDKRVEAIQLGIEALKAHKQRREDPKGNWSYLLPGETEE